MTGTDEPVRTELLHIQWLTDGSRLPEMTSFFIAGIHDRYMSHGDMMEGRADRPGRWSDHLEERHNREISGVQLSGGRFSASGLRIVVAEIDGEQVGYALVAVVSFPTGSQAPVRYARLDDLVVSPQLRGRGIGSRMILWIEEQLQEAGVPRLFLEAGINNVDARRLYERRGFTVTSSVMLKEL